MDKPNTCPLKAACYLGFALASELRSGTGLGLKQGTDVPSSPIKISEICFIGPNEHLLISDVLGAGKQNPAVVSEQL